MTRKVRIETVNNGWILILIETESGMSADRIAEKMVFSEWPKLLVALARWLGPDSDGGPKNL